MIKARKIRPVTLVTLPSHIDVLRARDADNQGKRHKRHSTFLLFRAAINPCCRTISGLLRACGLVARQAEGGGRGQAG